MEVDEIVVGDGLAPVRLEQLGGETPLDQLHARGDEQIDDAPLGRLGHGHLAGGASEDVGALVGCGAHAHAQLCDPKLHIAAFLAACLDDGRHVRPILPIALFHRGFSRPVYPSA